MKDAFLTPNGLFLIAFSDRITPNTPQPYGFSGLLGM